MLEVCPVCSDIMSEINAMFEPDVLLTMETLSSASIEAVRDTLDVMYVPDAVEHFMESWYYVITGDLNASTHAPDGTPTVFDGQGGVRPLTNYIPSQRSE